MNVRVGMGVKVCVGVDVDVNVVVGVNVDVLVGVKVLVGVEVGDGKNVGTMTVGMENPNPMSTATVIIPPITFPMVIPFTAELPALTVAAKIPRDVRMYFTSPSSLSAVMPNCLKRLSLLSANVFNRKASRDGISMCTCTLPAVRLAIFSLDVSVFAS